jgi:hypothetical protein
VAEVIVVAEGQSEARAVTQVLAPHLRAFSVFIKPELVGKKVRHDVSSHHGGVLDYKPVREHIRATLRRYDRPHQHVTTMIDFYSLPANTPGTADARHVTVPDEAATIIERAMSEDVGDVRFIPYLQLHEFEALVLADVDRLADHYRDIYSDWAARIGRLSQLVNQCGGPEHVNGGRKTHPAARIISEFPAYQRAKSFVGPAVAAAIGLPRLREACPHFSKWVTRLEQLGQQ